MSQHPEAAFWLCVGDVADDQGRYLPLPAPLHFIKGNNEGFDVLAAGALPANLHFLPNAVLRTVDGVRVAGLGGTFAPTWYETPAAALPHPTRGTAASGGGAPRAVRDDKRRHFVREEVDGCGRLGHVDVFMTHEAPRPYVVGSGGRRGMDAGKTPVNEVLAALKPRLHLFGHHHRFTEAERQGVPSVGLDLVSKSYLIVDSSTFEYQVIQA